MNRRMPLPRFGVAWSAARDARADAIDLYLSAAWDARADAIDLYLSTGILDSTAYELTRATGLDLGHAVGSVAVILAVDSDIAAQIPFESGG